LRQLHQSGFCYSSKSAAFFPPPSNKFFRFGPISPWLNPLHLPIWTFAFPSFTPPNPSHTHINAPIGHTILVASIHTTTGCQQLNRQNSRQYHPAEP
jgi:hypothetical protein